MLGIVVGDYAIPRPNFMFAYSFREDRREWAWEVFARLPWRGNIHNAEAKDVAYETT